MKVLRLCGCVLFMLAAGVAAGEEPVSPAPQIRLEPILKIDWAPGTDLPQGLQDSDGGVIGRTLVTACGFCSGGLEEDNRQKPGRYPRGFLKKVWGIDLDKVAAQWNPLPEFPGAARQGLFSAEVGDALYLWGGFSYDEPFDLPMSVVDGDKIYLMGGETGGGTIDGEYFGHHPDLFLIGNIAVAPSADGGEK